MARLTDEEKTDLLRVLVRKNQGGKASGESVANQPPPPRRLTPLEYIEFATWASQFDRSVKPVAFGGEHWKL